MESSELTKTKNFTSNPFFRLVAPLILGILIYFLVLLVFDTIDQFETNFFRAELILCLLISYFVSETNRFLIIVLENKIPNDTSITKRIIIQVVLSSLLIVLVTSLAVSFYMNQLVGFKSFSSELIVFNSLFVVLGWCLHAVYFSMLYLKRVADIQYNNEKSIRTAIEVKMKSSLNELKPKFLNKCLETLIVLSYKDSDEADSYLEKLSDFYRGKLTSRNELIRLNEEIETMENFLAIHQHWTNINVQYGEEIESKGDKVKIMHGAIRLMIEHIIKSAILLPDLPVNLFLKIKDNYLELSSKLRLKLNREEYPYEEIDNLNKSYSFHINEKIEVIISSGAFTAKIPLLEE